MNNKYDKGIKFIRWMAILPLIFIGLRGFQGWWLITVDFYKSPNIVNFIRILLILLVEGCIIYLIKLIWCNWDVLIGRAKND